MSNLIRTQNKGGTTVRQSRVQNPRLMEGLFKKLLYPAIFLAMLAMLLTMVSAPLAAATSTLKLMDLETRPT